MSSSGNVEYFVDVASDYESDFVMFPEMFTLQLLACEKEKLRPEAAIERLTDHTATFIERMSRMAIAYNINIIGGSHPTRTDDGEIQNVAYVFLRDGAVHAQEKLHPTPDERYWWNIQGGDEINAIQTDCGPIGVLVCYDSEFPELARRLVDQGARILFVPYCTDTRQGYLRVRYCCQARAVENQCYVVTSGNVGNLPNVENMDIQYAQSAIFTPCDFPFARDGIAAEASENVEMVAVADLNLANLSWARSRGTVRNLGDPPLRPLPHGLAGTGLSGTDPLQAAAWSLFRNAPAARRLDTAMAAQPAAGCNRRDDRPATKEVSMTRTTRTGGLLAAAFALAMLPAAAQAEESYGSYRNLADETYGGYTVQELLNGIVVDEEGETIGRVKDLAINSQNQITKVIVQGEGPLGMNHSISVDVGQIQAKKGKDGKLYTGLTEKEIENLEAVENRDGEWRVVR